MRAPFESDDLRRRWIQVLLLRLQIGSERLHVPFDDFPSFRDAPLEHVRKVTLLDAESLHWPALDIDLARESIRHPERFPLVAR